MSKSPPEKSLRRCLVDSESDRQSFSQWKGFCVVCQQIWMSRLNTESLTFLSEPPPKGVLKALKRLHQIYYKSFQPKESTTQILRLESPCLMNLRWALGLVLSPSLVSTYSFVKTSREDMTKANARSVKKRCNARPMNFSSKSVSRLRRQRVSLELKHRSIRKQANQYWRFPRLPHRWLRRRDQTRFLILWDSSPQTT